VRSFALQRHRVVPVPVQGRPPRLRHDAGSCAPAAAAAVAAATANGDRERNAAFPHELGPRVLGPRQEATVVGQVFAPRRAEG
jgi:hypothetical protein